MNNIARRKAAARAELFRETASRLGVSEAVVEKDFWVCCTLKQIFSIDSLRERLLFQGGTSLSKLFGVIHRFSEDVDLAADYAALGFTGERASRRPNRQSFSNRCSKSTFPNLRSRLRRSALTA